MKLIIYSKSKGILFIAIESIVYGLDINNNSSLSVKQYNIHGVVANSAALISIEIDEKEEHLYAIYSNKYLCCWNIASAALISTKILRKKATGLILPVWYGNHENSQEAASDRSIVIVSDKSGDIWGYNCPQLNKEVLLAGHTSSIITDLVYCKSASVSSSSSSALKQLVISSDRDEKIRISSFPDLERIFGYCLGHKSVISSLALITLNDQPYLISASWDHKLVLWNLSNDNYSKVDELLLASSSTVPAKPSASDSTAVVDGDQQQQLLMEGAEDGNKEEDEEEKDNLEEAAEEQKIDGDEYNNVEEGGDENNEETDIKQYNEENFGNFPMKICSYSNYLAVIYRNEAKIDLFSLQQSNSSSSSTFSLVQSLSLPSLPINISFIPFRDNRPLLAVLLPKPWIVQFYEIQVETHSLVEATENVFSAQVASFISQQTSMFSFACFLKITSYFSLYHFF
jgi:hypothetical protein